MKIDKEFESLIPPLSDEEFKQLEQNCIDYGIQDKLIVCYFPGAEEITLLDGHNRYRIAQKNNLAYETKRLDFKSRDKAIEWMILNQFGRRNLSAYDRSILALRLKPVLQEQAKERQNLGLKSDEGQRTDVALGKIAGVGKDTIHKVEVIQEKAPERVKELVKSGEISINQGYHETMNIIKPNPKPIEKQAKERHEEVKAMDVVPISEIKADAHDQVIIGLGICKDLIRLAEEARSIAEDEDLRCCEKLESEDIREAIKNCTKIMHQAEIIRRELLNAGKD